MELISNPTMAQRWREESFHRLISGRDQKWRTEPAPVRARAAGRLGHERKDCAAFLDARDTMSLVLSLCRSQHAVRVAVERGSPYQCASLRQCRHGDGRGVNKCRRGYTPSEQFAPRTPFKAMATSPRASRMRLAPPGDRHTIRSCRENLRCFRALMDCGFGETQSHSESGMEKSPIATQ